MEFIEISAKNVDDAITQATVQLGITSDQLEYEVLDKGMLLNFYLPFLMR